MKFRVCLMILVATLLPSCSRLRNKNHLADDRTLTIKDFLNKIKFIPVGYTYDLSLQDSENCYEASKIDSLYFPEYISVIGYLPDTSKYYNILYLEPGDDLYPSLKVFSKSGKILDYQSIAYGDCASGDCELDSCFSSIRVINKSSIERSLFITTSKCDSLGKKITGEMYSKVRKNQIITIGSTGQIKFSDEKSNQMP